MRTELQLMVHKSSHSIVSGEPPAPRAHVVPMKCSSETSTGLHVVLGGIYGIKEKPGDSDIFGHVSGSQLGSSFKTNKSGKLVFFIPSLLISSKLRVMDCELCRDFENGPFSLMKGSEK